MHCNGVNCFTFPPRPVATEVKGQGLGLGEKWLGISEARSFMGLF